MALSKVEELTADILADMLQNSSTIEELCLKIGYKYASDRIQELVRNKCADKMNDFVTYKKTLKCAKCGDNRHYVLDFHHVDPTQKDYTISHNSHAKLETIMKEVQKCIPLCSNCHREFHYLEKTQNTTLQQFLEA